MYFAMDCVDLRSHDRKWGLLRSGGYLQIGACFKPLLSGERSWKMHLTNNSRSGLAISRSDVSLEWDHTTLSSNSSS
jgi:hypothetical protein